MDVTQDNLLRSTFSDFSGGANMSVDPTRISDNEYYCVINGRTRYGSLRPTTLPKDYSDEIPAGKKQGCYAAGNFLLVFVDGNAYYRDFSKTGTSFARLRSIQMDANVDIIYAELVPASTVNFRRELDDNEFYDVKRGVALTDPVSNTPSCAVVQDGINRPWLIFPDGFARRAHDVYDWQNSDDPQEDDREYVPIGKQMLHHNGILYIVSPDGREIYRSVSGRPLDFVIAVDSDGDRLKDPISVEASRVSHKVAYDPIQSIQRLNTNDGSFFISTLKSSFLIVPDFENTVYGEPTFKNVFLFSVACLNSFSLVDILGDSAFISSSGVHSFNAVLQTANEGKNAPFSSKVFKLFDGIIQDTTCATIFDNYAFFALNTIYGRAILIYDTIRKVYTGLDIYPGIGQIKMFAELKVRTSRRLFFITTDNKLYEFEASGTTATCQLYTKEFSSGDPEVEQKPARIRVVVQDIEEDGLLSVMEIVDRKAGIFKTRNIDTNYAPTTLTFPFGTSTVDTTDSITFKIDSSRRGWKCGIYLSFDFMCDLSMLEVLSTYFKENVSLQQQASFYA